MQTTELRVAPQGLSGAYCYDCLGFFPWDVVSHDAADTFDCPNCGVSVGQHFWHTGITSDGALFADNRHVYASSWFHSTTNPDWLSSVQNAGQVPLVHVGSRMASKQRHSNLRKSGVNEPFYLYETRLNASVSLCDGFVDDDNDDAPKLVGEVAGPQYDTFGATRYVNAYEHIGSVSLLVNPAGLSLVKRTLL